MDNRFEDGMKIFQEMLPDMANASAKPSKRFAPELGRLSIRK